MTDSSSGAVIISIISIGISLLSFVIAFIALWKTHFSKFEPIVTIGDLNLRIYPIKSEGKKWFIASFDLPVSIANEAARSGKIDSLRLVLHYTKLPIPNNKEYFFARWEVKSKEFHNLAKERFVWVNEAASRWVPFILLPKSSITKHLIFEKRWDKPVIQTDINLELEVCTDGAWKSFTKWNISIFPIQWVDMIQNARSYGFTNLGSIIHEVPETFPSDLHNYTGPLEKMPKNIPEWAPSYLDYPDKKKKSSGNKNKARNKKIKH